MGNLGSNARIRVTTQVLKQKAEEFTVELTSLRQEYDSLDSVMNNTKNYWRGESADHQRSMYSIQKNAIDSMLNRLSEHPIDLKQMAGIYEEAEQINVSYSGNLPGDVIS